MGIESKLILKIYQAMYSFVKKNIDTWPEYQEPTYDSLPLILKKKVKVILIYISLKYKYRKIIRKRKSLTMKLKNVKSGRPGLLILAGPSSNSLLPLQVKKFKKNNGVVAVVNKHFERFSLDVDPEFYFIADPLIWNMSTWRKQIVNYCKVKKCTIFQPMIYENIGTDVKIEYFNNLSLSGIGKKINPAYPATYVSGVALYALSTMAYMGLNPIYVTGIDNSYHRNFAVDDINRIWLRMSSLHSESNPSRKFDKASINPDNKKNQSDLNADFPWKNLRHVLNSDSVFLNDLEKFLKNHINLVNIGNDDSNDILPRAQLI